MGMIMSSLVTWATSPHSRSTLQATAHGALSLVDADQALLQVHTFYPLPEDDASRTHDASASKRPQSQGQNLVLLDHRAEESELQHSQRSSTPSLVVPTSMILCFASLGFMVMLTCCGMQRPESKTPRQPVQWTQQSLCAVPAKSLAALPAAPWRQQSQCAVPVKSLTALLSRDSLSTGCSGPSPYGSVGTSGTPWPQMPGTYGTLPSSATAPGQPRHLASLISIQGSQLPSSVSLSASAWEATRL